MVKTTIEEIALDLLRRCSTSLPNDVMAALRNAYELEEGMAKVNIGLMIENALFAGRCGVPICQDTGFVIFYVGLGRGITCNISSLEEGLRAAVSRATEEMLLRSNMVDVISGKYLERNVGNGSPTVKYYSFRDVGLKITALLKGAGSENCSYLHRLDPEEGLEVIVDLIVEDVVEAGAKPCPPVIIGVGIGGTSERALELAKLALLKPLDEKPEGPLSDLEERVFESVNSLGIGPMGLGGRFTALGVKIETSPRHLASLHVGVNLQCWALRRASAYLDAGVLR